jgi:hypothetical protein
MNAARPPDPLLLTVLRWLAGISSLALAGLVHFAVTGFGQFPRGWAFPLLAVPGVLFLLCWFWRRRTPRAHA